MRYGNARLVTCSSISRREEQYRYDIAIVIMSKEERKYLGVGYILIEEASDVETLNPIEPRYFHQSLWSRK